MPLNNPLILTESALTLADNTTDNASTNAHGFMTKLSGVATDIIGGDGAWRSSGPTTIWGPPWGYSAYAVGLTANSLYLVKFNVGIPSTLTGIQTSNDSPANNNIKIGLWNAAGTTLLASSGSVGISGTWIAQCVPFSVAYVAQPGAYLMGVVVDSATPHLLASQTAVPSSIVAVGSFNIPATVSVPAATARIANCPVMLTY